MARRIVGFRPARPVARKSKKVPEDEMVLAELIAAASEHRLTGCKGARFKRANGFATGAGEEGFGVGVGVLSFPPEGAAHCCALGAQMLAKPNSIEKPVREYDGNDASDENLLSDAPPRYIRDWNIGAAFNQAMEES